MADKDLLIELQELVTRRIDEHVEGSYTAYLIDAGLDKILKKVGEESAETIIAAKNLAACANDNAAEAEAREALKGEAGDLLYHLIVMLEVLGVGAGEVEDLLRERMKKKGNLKDGLKNAR